MRRGFPARDTGQAAGDATLAGPPGEPMPGASARSLHRQLVFVLFGFLLLVMLLLAWSSYDASRDAVQQRAAAMAERQATLLAFLLDGVEAGLRAHLTPLDRDQPPLPGSPRRITAFPVDAEGQLSHPDVAPLLPPRDEWAAALGRATAQRERAIFTRPVALESGTWSWGLLQLAGEGPSLIAAPFRLDRLLHVWRQAADLDGALLVILDRDGRPWLVLPQFAAAPAGEATSGLLSVRAPLKRSDAVLLEGLGNSTFLVSTSAVGEHGLTVLVGYAPGVVTGLWLADHLGPVLLSGLLLLGTLLLVYGFGRKLTRTLSEREAALGALAVSETRFRDFAGASSDWFWESDPAHRLTWVSRRVEEGRDAAPSPLLGRSLVNLQCSPAEEQKWHGYLEDLRQQRAFRDLVCRMRLNGAERWMKLSGTPILDEAGQFLGYRGTATDIDAQRQAEEQIETLHRRLVGAFEVALDAAAIFDAQDRLVMANDRYVESFFPGCSALVKPGLPYREIPERLEAAGFPDLAQQQRELQQALESLRGSGEGECTIALSDGCCWFQICERVTRRGDHLRVFADVSDFKRREEELRLAKESAELADRAKTEFLAVMSHELRTPLNAIIGFSDILRSELFGPLGRPRYRDYAEDINRSGRHLLDIINDILDTSKAEAGRLELQEEVVALDDLTQRAMSMIITRAEEADVQLHVALPTPPVQLQGDRRKLLQMLLNLLSNAVKFTPPGGSVTVSAEVKEAALALCVTDTGIGIAEEDVLRVQEPFIQLASPLCRDREGTGLGLPLAKRIAELHGARLLIESTLGRGTKVCALIPSSRLVVSKEAGPEEAVLSSEGYDRGIASGMTGTSS